MAGKGAELEEPEAEEVEARQQRETASAFTALVERLAVEFLDETVEPEHFGALMRSVARAGQVR